MFNPDFYPTPFKNRDDWAALNRRYAKIKGQSLPEKL